MNIIKKKLKLNKTMFSIEIPEEYLNKEIEVIINTKDDKIEDLLLLGEISIDTRKWKFRREDIYQNEA